ncbi:nucleolar complex-associated protein 3 [Metschnikowia bicuspidata var. bicuspidata NRRL YB-4993]|uniref:Nucleolar complex-associated protein 3 n=1 Tax=Metschnikowia bicuspidata var. bicuspidata NRRL YB-4993 TaxID=869754 RepID=A0A1A0HHJ8_9ASCO|nr:nucleolar complex-associated protein 3 [Metschnikowia bicuspidata var. bicuspidata NRRL YB-4993]OBA23481.1 nucleolar complex-associated protein 3 [Metschnikowia bicuspidata var. bicuspidata NRRL YB-4993]
MGKRHATALDRRLKKTRGAQDALLASGVFAAGSPPADWEDAEQEYELAPRSLNIDQSIDTLPIKRAGRVERMARPAPPPAPAAADIGSENGAETAPLQPEQHGLPPAPPAELSPAEQLLQIKAEIAQLAAALMEDPEEHIDSLGKLRRLAEAPSTATAQLAILALVPVFKALAPGYAIRALSAAEQAEQVGRDVARLRRFEQNLVVHYRDYVGLLGRLSRVLAQNSQNRAAVLPAQVRLGELAAKAACELCVLALRHFNYRDELLTIVIRRLNRRPAGGADLEVFTRCVRALETVLAEDRHHGSLSHDVARIMGKVLRDKKFRVDEAVVNVFLSLALLDDYDPAPPPLLLLLAAGRVHKKARVHLLKKQRKVRKELKDIDEEMRRAEQAVTADERRRFQAQTLALVLTLYLQILKAGALEPDAAAPVRLLTAAVMEGLARFGLMANFDLLGDFLEVLKETMASLVHERTLQTQLYGIASDAGLEGGVYLAPDVRKVLLCVTAAFSLLLNHAEVGRLPISFDLLLFVHTLYAVVADVCVSPDLEFSHRLLRLADPLAEAAQKPAVNVSTNAELLLKSLDMVFFRSRNGSVARARPFTKRLYVAALHAPEKTTVAALKFVAKLVNKYGDGLNSLWSTEENISGEGSYILGYEKTGYEVDLERTNVGSAVLWENVLLDRHYSAVIKDGSRSLMKNSKDTGARR